MKIYRSENSHGLGPLNEISCARSGVPWFQLFNDHNNVLDYPGFGWFVIEPYHKFGMVDLDSLFNLVKSFDLLHDLGYHLAEYEITNELLYIVTPDNQIVYDSRYAIFVSKTNIH